MEIIFNPEVKNTSLTCMSSSGSTCFFLRLLAFHNRSGVIAQALKAKVHSFEGNNDQSY